MAVKVIRPELAADPKIRNRLRREVKAARRVPRFCTAQVLAANLRAEPPYVVTEYIDAPTLDVAVLERGPLAGAELAGLAAGVALEPRRRLAAFLDGMLAELPRKNCWTIAEHAGESCPSGMQHFLNRAVWDTDGPAADLRGFVVDHLGEADAVLVVDETGM